MLSRRSFLFGSVAGLTAAFELASWQEGLAIGRKPRKPVQAVLGPHSISRQEWPPAIVPDHMGIANGYGCLVDEFGRLAVVDMRRPGNAKMPVRVVGELAGLGKKVLDFTVANPRAYALVSQSTEGGDPQFTLVTISLTPIDQPSVVSRIVLDRYADLADICASPDTVCIAGTSTAGENLVTFFSSGVRQRQAPAAVGSMSVQMPVQAIDLQNRHLAILSCQPTQGSQIDYVNLANPSSPYVKSTVQLDGEYKLMARTLNTAILAGRGAQEKTKYEALSVILEPQAHAVSHMTLDPISQPLSMASQKDRFVVLGEARGGPVMISVFVDRALNMTREQVVSLPQQKAGLSSHPNVALLNKVAYVASGWSGVQMLSYGREGWAPIYTYSIPRLPASGVATWGDLVVLAGSDLKLYNIGAPERPSLMTTATVTSAIKSIAGAGSYVLCLGKDAVTLRKMEKLNDTIASLNTTGNQICYDTVQQVAYVLKDQDKKTVVQRVKVYSNSLSAQKSFDLKPGILRATANGAYLLAGGLNDLWLYGVNDNAADMVGSRHFENLAIRDFALGDDIIVASAVDQNSKGFFLVLAKEQKDLHVLGSVDLPHDGIAIAMQGRSAISIGRNSEGKSIASVINFSSPAAPRIATSFPVVESASAVTIKDRYAIVVGRGLEILAMSG